MKVANNLIAFDLALEMRCGQDRPAGTSSAADGRFDPLVRTLVEAASQGGMPLSLDLDGDGDPDVVSNVGRGGVVVALDGDGRQRASGEYFGARTGKGISDGAAPSERVGWHDDGGVVWAELSLWGVGREEGPSAAWTERVSDDSSPPDAGEAGDSAQHLDRIMLALAG